MIPQLQRTCPHCHRPQPANAWVAVCIFCKLTGCPQCMERLRDRSRVLMHTLALGCRTGTISGLRANLEARGWTVKDERHHKERRDPNRSAYPAGYTRPNRETGQHLGELYAERQRLEAQEANRRLTQVVDELRARGLKPGPLIEMEGPRLERDDTGATGRDRDAWKSR